MIGYYDRRAALFVADDSRTVVGTYYLRANNRGGGARGQLRLRRRAPDRPRRGGAMGTHSLTRHGRAAMQFNCVASNERAVRLAEPGAIVDDYRGLRPPSAEPR